ncbi:MAG: NAD(P)/FAD-dependent oxidoreductase [Gemmatimonadaceae bacterium]
MSPQPFWLLQNGLGDVSPPLHGNSRCDVVVVGAGITGALCADALTEAGASVIVVDKRQPGLGSTSATTALLQYELDVPLIELAHKVGERRATDAYRAALAGVRATKRISHSLPVDVGFHSRPTLYIASSKKDARSFAEECKARRAVGLPCEVLTKADLREMVDFDAPLALRSTAGAEVDPWRLTHALLERSRNRGARIYGRTRVRRITPSSRHVEVITDRGKLRTSHVVIASGYEAEQFLPQRVAKLHSTYAIATEPVAAFSDWPGRSLIWESARPYLYMRTTQDNRLMAGGLDDPFRNPRERDRRVRAKARRLLLKARRYFPRIEMEIAVAWAGTFGETKDSLPFVGVHPDMDDRLLFALAYGANGIPFGCVAAQMISARVTGEYHRYQHTFIFDR